MIARRAFNSAVAGLSLCSTPGPDDLGRKKRIRAQLWKSLIPSQPVDLWGQGVEQLALARSTECKIVEQYLVPFFISGQLGLEFMNLVPKSVSLAAESYGLWIAIAMWVSLNTISFQTEFVATHTKCLHNEIVI